MGVTTSLMPQLLLGTKLDGGTGGGGALLLLSSRVGSQEVFLDTLSASPGSCVSASSVLLEDVDTSDKMLLITFDMAA